MMPRWAKHIVALLNVTLLILACRSRNIEVTITITLGCSSSYAHVGAVCASCKIRYDSAIVVQHARSNSSSWCCGSEPQPNNASEAPVRCQTTKLEFVIHRQVGLK